MSSEQSSRDIEFLSKAKKPLDAEKGLPDTKCGFFVWVLVVSQPKGEAKKYTVALLRVSFRHTSEVSSLDLPGAQKRCSMYHHEG